MPELPITVTYRTDLHELADGSGRAHSQARGTRWIRWGFGAATAAILAGGVYQRVGGGRGVLAAALAGASSLLLYAAASAALQRYYVRRAWRAQLGEQTNIEMEVSVTAGGLAVRQQARTSMVPWRDVERARDERFGVAIDARDGVLVHIPARAFGNAAERAAFVRAVEQQRQEAPR